MVGNEKLEFLIRYEKERFPSTQGIYLRPENTLERQERLFGLSRAVSFLQKRHLNVTYSKGWM